MGKTYDKVNLTRADLIAVNLTGTNLTEVNLTRANLTDADLTDADLTWANLTLAKLTRGKLTRGKLINADLTRADLTDADLTDADLTRADLTDADLTRAIFGPIEIPAMLRTDGHNHICQTRDDGTFTIYAGCYTFRDIQSARDYWLHHHERDADHPLNAESLGWLDMVKTKLSEG